MALSKERKRAKAKRRELRDRIKQEQELSRERKNLKAEINRRFSSGNSIMIMDEDYWENNGRFDDEDFEILSYLAKRMFFRKLEQSINKKPCDNTNVKSRGLLSNLFPKDKEKVDSILTMFKKYGGYCDCEILLNINSFLMYSCEYDDIFGYDSWSY